MENKIHDWNHQPDDSSKILCLESIVIAIVTLTMAMILGTHHIFLDFLKEPQNNAQMPPTKHSPSSVFFFGKIKIIFS